MKPLDRSTLSINSNTNSNSYANEIADARNILLLARDKENNVDPNTVVENLVKLERTMPKQNLVDNGETSNTMLQNLNGAWRLVFTTGTKNIQKNVGRINYFPLKAIQCFNTKTMKISNGIFFGDVAALRFSGYFTWNMKIRKLEFNFDKVAIFGFQISLPSSPQTEKKNSGSAAPFFKWIYADEQIAMARGGGGGLALWRRVDEDLQKELLSLLE
jgi:hypothetical protein